MGSILNGIDYSLAVNCYGRFSILSLLLTDYNLLEDELSYQRANVLIEFVIHHV